MTVNGPSHSSGIKLQTSHLKASFNPRPDHVGFGAVSIALVKVFLRIRRSYLVVKQSIEINRKRLVTGIRNSVTFFSRGELTLAGCDCKNICTKRTTRLAHFIRWLLAF
jgi:hypothetical protein